MPVASGNGVMFTLCSGSGGQQVGFGKDGTPANPDTGAAHAGPCAFVRHGHGRAVQPMAPAPVARRPIKGRFQ